MLTGILSILFGLVFGSFLSVCIYRIPLGRMSGLEELEEEALGGEEDIAKAIDEGRNSPFFEKRVTIAYPPRSFCPSCGIQLRWYHNIPLFSWLFLRGKCAGCEKRISFRYPLVEVLSAAFCFLSFQIFDPAAALLAFTVSAVFIVISFIDIDYYIIPNVITFPAVGIGLVLIGLNQFFHLFPAPPFSADLVEAGFGLLAGAGVLWFVSSAYMWLRKKEGLGMGDVKLLAVTGVLFGYQGAIYTIFVGSILGSVIGVLVLLLSGGKLNNYLPFGPYLAAANLLYLFTGLELLERFQSFIHVTVMAQ